MTTLFHAPFKAIHLLGNQAAGRLAIYRRGIQHLDTPPDDMPLTIVRPSLVDLDVQMLLTTQLLSILRC